MVEPITHVEPGNHTGKEMKVQNVNVSQIKSEAVKPAQSGAVQDQQKQSEFLMPEEKVTLSAEAVNFKAVEAELKTSPDVRTELVNRIQEEVKAGTYERPAGKVAEAIITNSLLDSVYR